jgi:hypothetical protein
VQPVIKLSHSQNPQQTTHKIKDPGYSEVHQLPSKTADQSLKFSIFVQFPFKIKLPTQSSRIALPSLSLSVSHWPVKGTSCLNQNWVFESLIQYNQKYLISNIN